MSEQLASPDTSIMGDRVDDSVDTADINAASARNAPKRPISNVKVDEDSHKRVKIPTPDMTKSGETDNADQQTPSNQIEYNMTQADENMLEKEDKKTMKMRQREQAKLERERRKEKERLDRESKKEEERLRKEEERVKREKKKEEERLQREVERQKREEEKRQKQMDKEQEKELKRRKIEEERLGRERKKEEEKQKKKAEKDEKEKQRLEKKRKLEEEKEKREEMERKAEEIKQRNQKKISSFFSVGAPQKSTAKKEASVRLVDQDVKAKIEKTAYEQMFLPFFIKKNMKMAPSLSMNPTELTESKASIDDALKSGSPTKSDIHSFFTTSSNEPAKEKYTTPKFILQALNSSDMSEGQVYDLFENLAPIKYLHFYEHSRSPYVGTWCSTKHQDTTFPIQDPFNTTSTGIDYDYESDIEWIGEEEGEGEDIDGDDDDEDEDDLIDEDEDMVDFVEDENETRKKRRLMGPLEPINIWNHGSSDDSLKSMRFESLDVDIRVSIDPYHDYWKQKRSQTDNVQTQNSENGNGISSSTVGITSSPTKKTIGDDKVISELIAFIEKNDSFTIGTLVELAKRDFVSYTKILLKQTIQEIAVYNKKTSIWEIKEEIREKYPNN